MLHRVIAAVAILAFPLLTAAFFYGSNQRRCNEGKSARIPIVPGFRAAFRWVQLSTAIVLIANLFGRHWALMQLYDSVALLYAGVALSAGAMALFVWAKMRLGAQFSPCCESLVANRLVDSGPYAYVRHPIYTAHLAWQIGALLATGSIWMLINVGILLLYYVTSARQEERALSKELPGYSDYMARTGAFLPTLTPRRAR